MKFCVHKKPYIVHCCDDKSILMHDEYHDVDFGDFYLNFHRCSKFYEATDDLTIHP